MGDFMNESKSIITQQPELEYELLVSNISTLWQKAKNKAVLKEDSAKVILHI